MKSERSLEYLASHHNAILAAASMQGVDLSPPVGGATRLIGYGDTKYGHGPACVIDLIHTEYVMEPHVIWFPWVGPADMIKNFRWAMQLMRKTHQVLLNVELKHKGFFEHFVKKGFLRKIGHIEDLPKVGEIHMYQVRELHE